ncbi:MAG: response regulator, partial [Christensenellaceae bacterium]|nr:response regulator [Christensenellaceae bacterium]
MHTLLIVDDEYFVREGLKSTINWAACGITVVGEATNGKDALQKVAEFSPDIIISDIKMPVMNGIVFIEELNKIKFDGEIILLSGYSDFDFAQKAIESGVFAYILKPLRNEVIIEKVKDAVKHLEKKRGEQSILNSFLQDSNLLKQKLLADCANGVLPESEAATKIRLFGATLITNGFVIVGTAGESQSSAGQTPLLTLAGGILDRLKDERNKCFCVEDLSGFKIITEEDSQEKVHRIVLNALEAYEAENGCPASVGISVRFETFTG